MSTQAVGGISLEAVLSRLLRAKEQEIPEIVGQLPEHQRADLAVFCYGRGHLQEIGFAIAATCELPALMQAAPSNAAGNALFAQSRRRPKQVQRPAAGSRARITLAKSASGNSDLARIIASLANDDMAECQPA